MNQEAATFLAGIPALPNYQDYRATWQSFEQFQSMIGALDYGRMDPVSQSGGNPDPDSFRGFSATSNNSHVPTANGWTVYYTDNPNFGSGILGATSPSGEKWTTAPVSFKEYFVRVEDQKRYNDAQSQAIHDRGEYLYNAHPRIDLKFDGWYLEENTWWIRHEKESLSYRLWPDHDAIAENHGGKKIEADWWYEGITIQGLF